LLALCIITFALSFVFNSYYTRVSAINHEKRSLTRYIQTKELDFNEVIKDTHLLRKLVQNRETLDEFKSLEEKEYGIYIVAETIFGTQQMLFWNNQNIIPPATSYNLDDGEYFTLLDNGYYVIVKRSFALNGMSNKLWTYALIPVKSKYYIESQFLNDEFAYSRTAHKRIIISSYKNTDYPIRSSSARFFFILTEDLPAPIPNNDPITVILRLLSLCFFFVFAHSLAEFVAQKRDNQWRGVLL
jgi:hypothetical protein